MIRATPMPGCVQQGSTATDAAGVGDPFGGLRAADHPRDKGDEPRSVRQAAKRWSARLGFKPPTRAASCGDPPTFTTSCSGALRTLAGKLTVAVLPPASVA